MNTKHSGDVLSKQDTPKCQQFMAAIFAIDGNDVTLDEAESFQWSVHVAKMCNGGYIR